MNNSKIKLACLIVKFGGLNQNLVIWIFIDNGLSTITIKKTTDALT